jgi:uncharacterized protein
MQSPADKQILLETAKPWYREFWAWFILTPLIVVVMVSTFTVSVAVRNADDRVIDNYYKEGRMINMRLDEDLAAAHLSLVADIVFDTDAGELLVTLQSADNTFPETITLALSHPSDQSLDHQILLTYLAKGQYRAELDKILSYRWYLRLHNQELSVQKMDGIQDASAKYAHWRLRGEIDFAKQSTVRLTATL